MPGPFRSAPMCPASRSTPAPDPADRDASRRRVRAQALLVVLTTAGLLGFALAGGVRDALGIPDFGHWFLDSHAVLAASDAAARGLATDTVNPLDAIGRKHAYSDWWLGLSHLGLTRKHNFLVGGSWVLAFLVAAWAVLRPRQPVASACFALLLLSPPVLLAVVRANNDLVVFTLLALAALALGGSAAWRRGTALAVIALATGLKFYPVAAGGVFLLLRPRAALLGWGIAAVAVLGAVLAAVAGTLTRGMLAIPPGLYTFGAPVWLRDLGWTGPGALAAAALVIGGAAIALARAGWTTGLAAAEHPLRERTAFALGALVLTACFLAGTSYAYRGIFALLLAPWLWTLATGPAGHPRRSARAAAVLLLATVWADGVYCVVANVFVGAMPVATRDRAELVWRLVSQPCTWALMALLAGWLLDALRAAGGEVRRAATPA